MIEYIQFIFYGTLVRLNVLRLEVFRTLFDAWLTQNESLTELNSPISVVHFPFATIFQNLNFVRLCSFCKLKFSYRCSLQSRELSVDILFHLWEIRKQT